MTEATPAGLQRLIATTFDAQGWEYDLSVGSQLVEAIQKQGGVDSAKLVRILPAAFFERNRVSKDLVSKVIERAIGGITLKEEGRVVTTIVIGGNNYQLNVGAGASIVNSNLNVGEGTQIVATADADKQDVLLAVEAIVRAGLAGDWNDEAAKELAALVDSRSDLDYEDVQKVAAEVVKAEQPDKQRVKDLLTRIATSGLAGALATGITTGVGQAITHLPFWS
jgi:hypothetical protein